MSDLRFDTRARLIHRDRWIDGDGSAIPRGRDLEIVRWVMLGDREVFRVCSRIEFGPDEPDLFELDGRIERELARLDAELLAAVRAAVGAERRRRWAVRERLVREVLAARKAEGGAW